MELSTDSLYKDIKYRICLLQRQQILTTQSMLQQQMETLRDEKGRTLFSHASGEVVEVHKCKKVLVWAEQFLGSTKLIARFKLITSIPFPTFATKAPRYSQRVPTMTNCNSNLPNFFHNRNKSFKTVDLLRVDRITTREQQ